MRQAPSVYTLDGLIKALDGTTLESPDGVKWYPARPLGYHSLRNRLRAAWLVFTGRADAVVWPLDRTGS